MAPVLVTLNDLEGHSLVEAFSSAIRQTFVQHFTRFQLTSCSHSPSATAGLLVRTRDVYTLGKQHAPNHQQMPTDQAGRWSATDSLIVTVSNELLFSVFRTHLICVAYRWAYCY